MISDIRTRFQRPSYFAEVFLWVTAFAFLGVDAYREGARWMLHVGGFHVRWTHVAIALLAALTAFRLVIDEERRAAWRRAVLEHKILFFAAVAFLCVGLIAATGSERPSRSFAYWVFNAGVFLVLPLLMLEQRDRHARWWWGGLVAITAISMAVVVHDFLAGLTGRVHDTWGFVRHVNDHYVRPSAFRQEPGYFAAWMLILGTLSLSLGRTAKTRRTKVLLVVFWALCLAATVASTSRMGALAAFAILVLEGAIQLVRGVMRRNFLPVLIAAGAALLLWQAWVSWIPLYAQGWSGHLHQATDRNDPSWLDRARTMKASWRVYLANPVVGAGPGASGAYAVRHGLYPSRLNQDQHQVTEDSPLANSIFTEVPAEWGTAGGIAFLVMLAVAFRSFGAAGALRLTAVFALVWVTNETLPRLDWWVPFWIAWALALSATPKIASTLSPISPAKSVSATDT